MNTELSASDQQVEDMLAREHELKNAPELLADKIEQVANIKNELPQVITELNGILTSIDPKTDSAQKIEGIAQLIGEIKSRLRNIK